MGRDRVAGLAKVIRGDGSAKVMRLGTVTSIANIAGTPKTIDVDGKPMRFMGATGLYTVSVVVVYCNEGATPFVLGPLT